MHSLLEVVLGPALEPDLTEGEHDEEAQVPRHEPQPATRVPVLVRSSKHVDIDTVINFNEEAAMLAGMGFCLVVTGDRGSSPELGGDGGRRGEVGELLADAGEEEAGQAVAVDDRDARRREPPDEPEPDHVQVPPQPVPGEPVTTTISHRVQAQLQQTISRYNVEPS